MKSVSQLGLVVVCALLAGSVAFAADEKKSKDDGKKAPPKPVNKVCPVEKGEVDPEVTIQHDGKTIGFCCAGCDETFKKEPAKYMAIVDKELKDAAAKEKKDKKDGAKKKDEEPKLNTKCPVTGDGADKTMTADYKGRTIAFCCEGCIEDFQKEPKKYLANLDKEKAGDAKKDGKKDDKAGGDDKAGK